jgi:hypothetical protein
MSDTFDGDPPDDTPEEEEGAGPEATAALATGSIQPIELQEEMERSFLDYAMSVIVSRALPDARDGLKPCTAGSSTTCTCRATGPTGPT